MTPNKTMGAEIETSSTGLAHCSLLIVLATGVALMALVGDASTAAPDPTALSHIATEPGF
ncbi:hypothetical protein [Phaeobacter sp.]|uniref:hypothetical protein n=1 Tax=Phaeobacter sp. TaxID=1902409 RepID=UPI0025D1852D|nr:hypothetical protein [Phaeobacter sp.]